MSMATVVADPLPDGLATKRMSAPQASGTQWDSESLSFVPLPPSPPNVDRVEEFVGRLVKMNAAEIRSKLAVLLGANRWRAPTDDYEIGGI